MGTGGMGSVYRARMQGPGGASKQVALKLIHDHLAQDDSFVLMFLDEMRVAMGLSHRNIVHTFDAGEVEGGYYMVMELVPGESLRQMLDRLGPREPVPVDIALFIAREVAAALDYAHRYQLEGGLPRGLVHRDVSPANILLSTEGDVKLTDFGVAKAAGRLYVTQVNLVRGKAQYMSPEQASGQAEPRSDLFSLGAVLYEMLTGQPIRKHEMLDHMVLVRRPPAPSLVRSGLPVTLDALVMRCLELDPSHRPADAAELRRALASESARLQARDTMAQDPHLRLRGFLEELGVVEPSPLDPVPVRLAQAVLAEAMAMQTDPELEGLSAPKPEPAGADRMPPLPPDTGSHPGVEAVSIVELKPVDLEPVEPAAVEPEPVESEPVESATHQEEREGEILTLTMKRVERPRPRGLLAAGGLVLLAVAGVLFWSITYQNRPAKPVPADAGRSYEPAPPDGPVTPEARPDLQRRRDARRRDTPGHTTVRLTPRPPQETHGTLSVNAVPWAVVYIDGRKVGETPIEGLRLRAGVHHLRLVNTARNRALTVDVEIPPGQPIRRVFELKRVK